MRLAKTLVRRGRVPSVTFESYIESRKLSVPRARPARTASHPARLEAALASPQRARTKGVRRQPAPPLESYRSPGRDQQEQLRVQRAWRPHSLRRSEHEPKECAGSLLRRGRVPHVAFELPLFAVGKRARPGKALKHLQGTVFSAEALSRPARPAFLLPFCCRRTPLVGSRCGQRSAASSLPFCCRRTPLVSFLFLSAAGASAGSEAFVAGRSLWTFSAESYAQQVFEHSRPAQLRGSWCSAPQRARTKGVRRQPAPPLESYRSPGRDQQEQLRVQRAWRPHLLRRSEHEPKECAGSLLRRGRVPNVAFEWPLFAVGKRARPGKALKHLQGTVFSAEALSRPARPAFLLPFCCRRTPLVGSRCGQRSASSLPFCCRRTPLVSFLFLSAAGASAGSEAFVAGRSLWTFSAESYAQRVFEHSRPAQLRGSWCSGITPAQHARGAGFNPRPVHAHVRLRLSQFASPWSFIPLGLLCVLPRPAGTPRPGAKRHF